MRNGFGRYAQELRAKRNLSQSEFSKLVGLSLSRVSNIEYQRTNISEDTIRLYLKALKCSGEEACELRKRAIFANEVRKVDDSSSSISPLLALFKQFSDRVSPESRAEIQKILERETGERISALHFSSNKTKQNRGKTSSYKRPNLTTSTLVRISLFAEEVRRRFANETDKLDLGLMLEKLSATDPIFDYQIVDHMPSFMDGAFASIYGSRHGHTLLLEESRFLSAEKGVYFARHVVAHEIGHHFLHGNLLETDEEVILQPQSLAKNDCKTIGSAEPIEQVIDSVSEVEAECFATFLLVPWTAFLKGTDSKYLASDYGEQPQEVRRYAPFFKNPVLLDAYREALWNSGERSHPIFHLG